MASGVEHDNLTLFKALWKAPVAVMDRFPNSEAASYLRANIGRRAAPDGFDYAFIGQEAVVTVTPVEYPGMVTKFMPTNPDVIYDRLDVLNQARDDLRRYLGHAIVGSVFSIYEDYGRFGSADAIVQDQQWVEGEDIKLITSEGSDVTASDNLKLADQVKGLIDASFDALSGYADFVPDFQGRGKNVIVTPGRELVVVDQSPFTAERSEYADFHPLAEREKRNTMILLGRFANWLNT